MVPDPISAGTAAMMASFLLSKRVEYGSAWTAGVVKYTAGYGILITALVGCRPKGPGRN